MNHRLTQHQKRALCSQLGDVTLKLLYRASVHGFTAAAFHQMCDEQGPTVSVGYNNSGYVFGGNKRKLLVHIQTYTPTISSVAQVRVLLIGPVGAGKSSFFNSIKSVFRGHVTNQAMAGSSGTSLTTMFSTYSIKAEKEGKPLPFIMCDTMGLEETTGAGLNVDDISSILRGHIPDRYQFNSAVPLQPEAQSYKKSPGLQDRIHCVVYVIDASKISIMPSKLEDKLAAIRSKINLVGIPQLVLLTKVDETCSAVAEDLTNVYRSLYIKTKAQEVSQRLGIPLSCVVPVKNYSQDLELDQSCDILILSAVNQMLRFAEDCFDEVNRCPCDSTPEKRLKMDG